MELIDRVGDKRLQIDAAPDSIFLRGLSESVKTVENHHFRYFCTYALVTITEKIYFDLQQN